MAEIIQTLLQGIMGWGHKQVMMSDFFAHFYIIYNPDRYSHAL
jgi:hypothetical protein